MTSPFESSQNESLLSEATLLAQRLESLGINSAETEQVVEQAVLLFAEGRPEHEVEQIIADFYQAEAETIAAAEAEADTIASTEANQLAA